MVRCLFAAALLLRSSSAYRAAVVLRGMSARDEHGRGPVDWRESFESLKANYLQPRRKANVTIEVFYHTYRSAETKALKEVYAPTRAHVTNVFKKNKLAAQQTSLLLALKLVLRSGPKAFDEVLATRFDLLFLQPVTAWNLMRDAFNVPFADVGRPKKHCDVLWVFPGRAVPEIVKDLGRLLRHPPHRNCCGGELHFYKPISLPLHFMFDGHFSSDTDWPERYAHNVNPLYELHRLRGGGGGGHERRNSSRVR